ncbi:hypothetical protein ACQ4PT_008422 [Festuca glaucescens]
MLKWTTSAAARHVALPDVRVEPRRSVYGTDGLRSRGWIGNRRRRSSHEIHIWSRRAGTPILLPTKLACHYLYRKVTSERSSQGTIVEVDLRSLKPYEFPGRKGAFTCRYPMHGFPDDCSGGFTGS